MQCKISLLPVFRQFSSRGYGMYNELYCPCCVDRGSAKSKVLSTSEKSEEKTEKKDEHKLPVVQNRKPQINLNMPKILKLRWGIAPVSLIADDFAKALNWLPKGHHQLTACAASYKTQAQYFAKKHDIPKIYSTFEELAKSNDVDVVYISPLTPMHLELSQLMLDNGKHVLCEKPLCTNEKQALKLIGISRGKHLFLMEAMWSRFLPAYKFIKNRVEDGKLGDVTSIECSFGFPSKDKERLTRRELGGGVTLDFGVYPIQFAQWIFRMAPLKINAYANLNEYGVDTDAKIEFDYNDRQAKFDLSSTKELENLAIIKGTKGKLVIPDYWCPTKIHDIDGTLKEFHFPKSNDKFNYPNRVGMLYQAEEVRQCLMDKRTESPRMSHNESLLLAKTIDHIRSIIGVKYPDEEGYTSSAPKDLFKVHPWLRIQ